MGSPHLRPPKTASIAYTHAQRTPTSHHIHWYTRAAKPHLKNRGVGWRSILSKVHWPVGREHICYYFCAGPYTLAAPTHALVRTDAGIHRTYHALVRMDAGKPHTS